MKVKTNLYVPGPAREQDLTSMLDRIHDTYPKPQPTPFWVVKHEHFPSCWVSTVLLTSSLHRGVQYETILFRKHLSGDINFAADSIQDHYPSEFLARIGHERIKLRHHDIIARPYA